MDHIKRIYIEKSRYYLIVEFVDETYAYVPVREMTKTPDECFAFSKGDDQMLWEEEAQND